jgi:hypothetical protein
MRDFKDLVAEITKDYPGMVLDLTGPWAPGRGENPSVWICNFRDRTMYNQQIFPGASGPSAEAAVAAGLVYLSAWHAVVADGGSREAARAAGDKVLEESERIFKEAAEAARGAEMTTPGSQFDLPPDNHLDLTADTKLRSALTWLLDDTDDAGETVSADGADLPDVAAAKAVLADPDADTPRLFEALKGLLDGMHERGHTHNDSGELYDSVADAVHELVAAGGSVDWHQQGGPRP